MKKYSLVLCFILGFVNTKAQKPTVLFSKAAAYYEMEKYDSAFLLFAKIYTKGRGSKSLLAKAHYNLANIYLVLKDTVNAKKMFESILYEDYNEMDYGGFGSGLMAEPYSLYKNNSCKVLANIYLAEKNYSKALKFVTLFDKEYPYRHFCGNEYSANEIYTAYMYAKCYVGLNDRNRAVSILLPHCLDNGLASNNYLVELATKLIKDVYTSYEIKKEIDNSIKTLNKNVSKNKSYFDGEYQISFLGSSLQISTYGENVDFTKRKEMTESEFYKYCFLNSDFIKKLITIQ
jgi:tetratricopeptide (TPR) repeat protein